MKTAEEWRIEINMAETTASCGRSPIATAKEAVIQQIQLDAWKQGMTDAADLITRKHEIPLSFGMPGPITQTILSARDNKTSL